jgi:hypothetical protein
MTPPPRNFDWLKVPIGAGSEVWRTAQPSRFVLVVIRTATTLAWLMDLLGDTLADARIQLVFTLSDDRSAYASDVDNLIAQKGGVFIPWSQAISEYFDLAIAASQHGGLEELRAPVLVLPHGPGYTKAGGLPRVDWPTERGGSSEESSVPPTVALTHESQKGLFPPQWETVVVGDPCMDSLRAGILDRNHYRSELGVSANQKLITISSSWGEDALFAKHPELAAELLATLPLDGFTVAAILHPNIWTGHGEWQVRTWLRRALDSGLRLIPYWEGWRGAIIASDMVIGDHGSVTFYAATLGVPVVIGSFGEKELVQTSPLAQLSALAPHLGSGSSIRTLIEDLAGVFEDTRYGALRDQSFQHPGEALERTRELIYRMLRLSPPAHLPRANSVAAPKHTDDPPTAQLISAVVTDCRPGWPGAVVVIERFPAAIGLPTETTGDRTLVANIREPDHRLRESASVLVMSSAAGERTTDQGVALVEKIRTDYPLARIQVCGLGNTAAYVRAGDTDAWLATDEDSAPIDHLLLGAAVHALLVKGLLESCDRFTFRVIAGPIENRLSLSHLTA